MIAPDKFAEQQALSWLIQINDPDFSDWEGWDRWMAAGPSHSDAYWRLAALEAEALETLAAQPARATALGIFTRLAPSRRIALLAAAITAVIAGVFVTWTQRTSSWVIETPSAQSEIVNLADGSQIALDGGTRLVMDRRHPRRARVEAGRALFTVEHDVANPFVVEVGDVTLTDLGTVFDVTRLQSGARVAVSKGRVRIEAPEGRADLGPGDSAVTIEGGLEIGAIAVEDVAAWREGRLTYDDARLDIVAQDLTRLTGRNVDVSTVHAGRRFTGTFGVNGPTQALRLRLETLLGVSIAEDGDGDWRMEPRQPP